MKRSRSGGSVCWFGREVSFVLMLDRKSEGFRCGVENRFRSLSLKLLTDRLIKPESIETLWDLRLLKIEGTIGIAIFYTDNLDNLLKTLAVTNWFTIPWWWSNLATHSCLDKNRAIDSSWRTRASILATNGDVAWTLPAVYSAIGTNDWSRSEC